MNMWMSKSDSTSETCLRLFILLILCKTICLLRGHMSDSTSRNIRNVPSLCINFWYKLSHATRAWLQGCGGVRTGGGLWINAGGGWSAKMYIPLLGRHCKNWCHPSICVLQLMAANLPLLRGLLRSSLYATGGTLTDHPLMPGKRVSCAVHVRIRGQTN